MWCFLSEKHLALHFFVCFCSSFPSLHLFFWHKLVSISLNYYLIFLLYRSVHFVHFPVFSFNRRVSCRPFFPCSIMKSNNSIDYFNSSALTKAIMLGHIIAHRLFAICGPFACLTLNASSIFIICCMRFHF